MSEENQRFDRDETDPSVLHQPDVVDQVASMSIEPGDGMTSLALKGAELLDEFEKTSDLAHLNEAITVLTRASHLTPDGAVSTTAVLTELGIAHTWRFRREGSLIDISGSVSAYQRAAELTPEGHPDLPSRLKDLASVYSTSFEATGNPSDIAKAISTGHKCVQLTPENDPDLPTRLSHLGVSYTCRFEHSGSPPDIAESILLHQRAVQLTPEGDADLPMWLSNLGVSYFRRFERLEDLSDLAEAISAHQRAVNSEGSSEDPRGLLKSLNNLAVSYLRRFARTGDPVDLSEAILALQRAVTLIPEGRPELPATLNNLGTSLRHRFQQSGDPSDIVESILASQRAVRLTPEEEGHLPGRLSNLGNSYICRFEKMGDLSDIAEAISVQQRAVNLTPKGHSDLPKALSNLGSSHIQRFHSTRDQKDLKEGMSKVRAAATYAYGNPHTKLNAAKSWARLATRHSEEWEDALPAFDTTIRLVALIAGIEQTVQGRYAQLQDAGGLATEAAAAACAHGHIEKALEWLEQGRCLVWSQLSHLRTPLEDLRAHDSELARRVEDVSQRLQSAGSSRGITDNSLSLAEKITVEGVSRTHLDLAGQWEELLKTVRAIPAFELFLQTPPCSTLLRNLPPSGHIIVINVDVYRCDAIALSHGHQPLHIPLPEFSLAKAQKHRISLGSQLRLWGLRMREEYDEESERTIRQYRRKRAPGDDIVSQVLRALWIEVVKPILDALKFSKIDSLLEKVPPRIWWCPTGALSFLPIHAAGIYQGPDSECILDYAVSSYTPTVTALTDRVKNNVRINEDVAGLFITSQPNVPGASPIPGTTTEARSVHAKFADRGGARVLILEGGAITVDECLKYMEDYSCIHLACHASQNASDLLKSRFLFHHGSLDLGTIIQRDLNNADLAFLSACQTSAGEEKLSDEAVHLAAGMLAAGYRRVVATMWAIGDRHAPEVANDFYEYLWSRREEGRGSAFDGSRSAQALHHAIQQLRLRLDTSEQSLLTWIPYVHFGY